MKGEILFDKMTNISDEYVAEAAIGDVYGNPRLPRQETRFTRFINSGWGVACLCAVISLLIVAALIRFSPLGAPTGPAGDPSVQYTFSYEFADPSYSDGLSLLTIRTGDAFTLETLVTNHGSPFSYTGSSTDFSAHAVFVHQDDERVTLTGFMACTDDYGTFRVTTGETGRASWFFSVPITTRGGVYDLVLSYGGVTQVFGGVLTVTAVEEAPAPETVFAPDDFTLEFGYQPSSIDGFIVAPRELTITVWVKNTGAAYIHHGYFAPDAKLRHAESGYTVDSMFGPIPDIEEMTIQTGEVGSATPCFSFPADAPAGAYDLVLSIRMNGHKVEQVFEGVLTVKALDTSAVAGTYVRLSFTITLYEEGIFTYYETMISSHIGSGSYTVNNGLVTLTDGNIPGVAGSMTRTFTFRYENQKLLYVAEASDDFMYIDLLDGAEFARVRDETVTVTPDLTGHPFSFGYERTIVGDLHPGDSVDIFTLVRNEGDTFTYTGDPFDFAPKAVLYHMDDPTYTVKGFPPPTGMEPRLCTVEKGDFGECTYTFTFPANAPMGEYGLILSYGEAQQVYEGVLTVTE